MSSDPNSKGKRASLDLFVPPSDTTSGNSDSENDARSYLDQRRQKLQEYVRTAKQSQRTIDNIRKTEEAIAKANKSS